MIMCYSSTFSPCFENFPYIPLILLLPVLLRFYPSILLSILFLSFNTSIRSSSVPPVFYLCLFMILLHHHHHLLCLHSRSSLFLIFLHLRSLISLYFTYSYVIFISLLSFSLFPHLTSSLFFFLLYIFSLSSTSDASDSR